METIQWIGFAFGLLLVASTMVSIARTLIVPRGLASRSVAVVVEGLRKFFLFMANRTDDYATKDRILVWHGPAVLLIVLLVWVLLFFFGYGLMLWPLIEGDFGQALRESGSSMLTLGYASTPNLPSTWIHFSAAATGLITVALQVAYLPTLYSSFNRREMLVTMLQSRAGAPAWGPEILIRHHQVGLMDNLPQLFRDWESWSADVAETHSTYPTLIYFRSPSPLRSWIVSLLAVMDAAALETSLNPSKATAEYRLCIRMGFLCLREIAHAVDIPHDPDPFPDDPIELTYEDFLGAIHKLDERGYEMERTPEEAWPDFRGWRVNYESVAYAIADRVVAPPGPWSGPRTHLPGMAILPQRPTNRTPDAPGGRDDRARGEGIGA